VSAGADRADRAREAWLDDLELAPDDPGWGRPKDLLPPGSVVLTAEEAEQVRDVLVGSAGYKAHRKALMLLGEEKP
jgi:hypothetical protein